MSTMRFTSSRFFVVFSYSRAHGLLLLRSRKTKEHPTRIDLLVQDVRALEMRLWFHGLMIEEAGVSSLAAFASKPAAMVEPGNRVYLIHGSDWDGYIIGGILQTTEDDGEDDGPSSLL